MTTDSLLFPNFRADLFVLSVLKVSVILKNVLVEKIWGSFFQPEVAKTHVDLSRCLYAS